MQGYDGPWYESQAPTPGYVRDDQYRKMIRLGSVWRGVVVEVFTKIHPKLRLTEEEHLTVIKQSLLEVFPDNRENSWGSFRGYATFGIGENLKKEIKDKCIENIHKALDEKREKWGEKIGKMLKPHVNRYVWSIPNGMVYRKAMRNFKKNASNQ